MTGKPFNCASASETGCCPERSMNRLEKSALPRPKPIGGMMTPSTSDVTIFPKAAPIITATARSITFPRAMNSLNSFHMVVSSCFSVTVLSCFKSCFLRFCRSLERYFVCLVDLFGRLASGWVVSFGMPVGNYLCLSTTIARVVGFRSRVLLLFGLSPLGDEIVRCRIDQSEARSTCNCRHDQLKISASQLLISQPVRRPVPVKLQRLRDLFYKLFHGVSFIRFVEADPQ